MGPVASETFRKRLAALSADAFATFVADLWTARDRNVRRTGERIVARDPREDAEEVLYALPADRDVAAVPSQGVDVVVAARAVTSGSGLDGALPADVGLIDADELGQIVLYAVDRDACARLLAEHLDHELPASAASENASSHHQVGPSSSNHPVGPSPRRPRSACDSPPADQGVSRETRDDAEPIEPVETTDEVVDKLRAVDRRSVLLGGAVLAGLGAVGLLETGIAGWSSAAAGRRDPERRVAPGVASDGVVDPAALADAHVRSLRDDSYTLDVERSVRGDDGSLDSLLAVRVAVTADRTYLARAETAGPHAPRFLGEPPARAAFWSDGDTYVRRISQGDETTYNEFDPPDNHVATWRYWVHTVPFGGRDWNARVFIAAVFEDVPTRLAGRAGTDDRPTYRIVSDDADPRTATPGFVEGLHAVEDVSVDALVDERGLVSSLDLAYAGEREGTPVRVERTVRYANVGDTAVERPPWYSKAVDGRPSTADS